MQGYYRWPTIHGDTLVFGSEDDLWSVPACGGIARRLTANLAVVTQPFFSPDGLWLAFSGREEGPLEVYVMPSRGGPIRRLTYLGASSTAMGWTPDGLRVLFSSDARQPFAGPGAVMSVAPEGGSPRVEPYGLAVSITFGPGGGVAIGRHSNDPARWKRYRGGTAGDIWVDPEGSGDFRPLVRLKANMARPMWIGDRIFFLSDHEGVGNIYSCLPDGAGLRRHTDLVEYYARFPSTDGRRIVFHAGGDLHVLDPSSDEVRRVEVEYPSPRVQRQRKYVPAARHLQGYTLHPEGHSLAITARGKCTVMGNWEGPAVALSDAVGAGDPAVRYRCAEWLSDGKRLVVMADRGGEDALEVHTPGAWAELRRFGDLDLGRVYALRASPTSDHVALWNNRRELVLVDLETGTASVIERNEWGDLGGAVWSADGQWVAYHAGIARYRTAIKLWNRDTRVVTVATDPVLTDRSPCFDPEGKYLYFVGTRDLDPVYDNLHFDLGFPNGQRPFLITLRKDLRSPFMPMPEPLAKTPPKDVANAPDAAAGNGEAETAASKKPPEPVAIELEGITERVVGFPVPEGIVAQIAAVKGKCLFLAFAAEGALHRNWSDTDTPPKGRLDCYDFEQRSCETLLTGISDFELGRDGATMVCRARDRLRVLKAGVKPDEKVASEPAGRKSGWVDLARPRLLVDPAAEWRQMAREAWRLQREYFWTPDMSSVDWDAVWARYSPLVERVGTRGEFSDLMWEMQGELGTSHAYEFGGDHRTEPSYPQGFLGADLDWDADAQAYRVSRIVQGAPGEPDSFSPLRLPGVMIAAGDLITAVNGRTLDETIAPQQALMNLAGAEVALTVRQGDETRTVSTRSLKSEFPVRYREWVESNRSKVHEATGGRVGYVHIPDMGAYGYAEFHRLYLAEAAYDALIVDVRFNRGGHVSQLLLEKLARKRVGYDVPRWGQPDPYPSHSVAGPMVMLTNQFAGSDGDIVSHCFKLMGLGPLIGTRTWGGVVGIGPHNPLADGGMTTQPEYSFWFKDVGWGVENYGTDPDIEVHMRPQDYAACTDPQLDRGIEVVSDLLERNPVVKPAFDARPVLSLPRSLPARREADAA